MEAFAQVLVDEGDANLSASAAEVIAYQQQLLNQGFSAEEIAQGKAFGLTDAEIESFRQSLIHLDPYESAGSLLDRYLEKAAVSRAAGQALLTRYTFQPSISVGGSPGLLAAAYAAAGNTLAQLNNSVATLQLANPLGQTALVDLRTRRIDLPADWMVSVSPAQANLAPGEQVSVTISVLTGSPAPQDSIPRLAVEAYAGGQLLGGLVMDVVVPRYVPFDGLRHVYLPQVMR